MIDISLCKWYVKPFLPPYDNEYMLIVKYDDFWTIRPRIPLEYVANPDSQEFIEWLLDLQKAILSDG